MLKKYITAASLSMAVAFANCAQAEMALTVEDIVKIFSKQKTRGLVLAPVTTDEEVDTKETFVSLPKEEQVNLNIEFDFDSTMLKPNQKPKLALLCQAMLAVSAKGFKIVGHTDDSGTEIYNMNLSKLRAEEVKRHLVETCDIDPDILYAEGVGEHFPFDETDPNADINRRVEFQVAG